MMRNLSDSVDWLSPPTPPPSIITAALSVAVGVLVRTIGRAVAYTCTTIKNLEL